MKRIVTFQDTKEWVFDAIFQNPLTFDTTIAENFLRIEIIASNVAGELNDSNNVFGVGSDVAYRTTTGMVRHLIEARPSTGTDVIFTMSSLRSYTRMDLAYSDDWYSEVVTRTMGTNQVLINPYMVGKCKLLFASMEVKF